ncbi:MAG: sugar 3,4-ketoisomerase [Dysgonomonas sp.]
MKERIITLSKIADRRGNLSVMESCKEIPFCIARAYWIYDVPGGQKRGSHAFKNQQEIIFALSGSFDVVLDDGNGERKYHLNRSNVGLYVPSKTWRYLENFSTNSLCLVLASVAYDENEYIRNYKEFKKFITKGIKYSPKEIDVAPQKISVDTTPAASVFDCNIIEFPIIRNRAGNITPINNSENIPFDIERVFYVYDIPSGESRGGHAHKTCHEILIAASGSFDVELDDGVNKRVVTLNRPMMGLHLPPGIWATESNYSSGAICLVFTSHMYEENDYLRKYSDFKEFRSNEVNKV